MQIEPADRFDVAAIRRFNRFYTQRLGLLQDGWLDSPFTLAQARVLYELSRRKRATATELGNDLRLDAGYLSRMLRGFEKRGLISRETSKADGRQSFISLTARGRKAFAPLETRSKSDVRKMLSDVNAPTRLLGAMETIETLLGEKPDVDQGKAAPFILRAPKHGDFGWMVTAHARLYAKEYGWVEPFEGLCAQIVADFVNNYDPKKERCWIAEKNGENIGCVMVVKDKPGVARLRLLLVDPKGRGLGVGKTLVDECIRFARKAGYRKMTLWTHSVLTAARAIYEKAGFKLTGSEKRKTWSQNVVAEFWDLEL